MILFLRHAPTAYDTGGVHRINGWRQTPPTAEGKSALDDQADRIADLEKQFGITIHPIVTSDLRRAADSAKVLGKALGQEVYPTAALRPWQVGDYEGKPSADAKPDLQYFAQHPNEQVPGGESYNTFLGRFLPFISEYYHREDPSQVPLLVTHGRNILTAGDWVHAGAHGLDAPANHVNKMDHVADGGMALAHDGRFEVLDAESAAGTGQS